ncbi:MAG TPA: hypothetical protein VLF18_22375 [Tahibacter sp.]|uniref:hypothetical protein n=1 Tax=Tahibacter sp. TaxID=2056211 RepID=UPI002D0E3394|nr:hypothetical protein [Tahibacter sp.]HSX62941.1 hypothetical protein [Tahibacter sp.]
MKATLTLHFESSSQLLKSLLSAEIRDSGLRLVATAHHGSPLELDAGLYRVTAVLENGAEQRHVVALEPGQRATLRLGIAAPLPAAPAHVDDAGFESLSAAIRLPLPVKRVVAGRLVAVRGAIETTASGDAHGFRTAGDGFAFAEFEHATRRWFVSLPVLTGGSVPGDGRDECTVRFDGDGRAAKPAARMSSWRTVASSVQQMLLQSRIEQVLAVADEATTALAEKYSDPAGAALGALLLHRVDRLAPLRGWVDNLARSFAWLVDARVLQAALAAQSESAAVRERGLSILLDCVRERALFTETHSLMLNLLRRWPDDDGLRERTSALGTIVAELGDIDWSALTLTTSQPLA